MRKDILEKKDQIIRWIEKNESKSFICRELKCKSSTLESYLNKFGIKYKGNMGLRGKKISVNKKPVSYFLRNGSFIISHTLKNKLIKEGIKDNICEKCHNKKWNGLDIPLELHHIDGQKFNNELSNLQILCPNCHAQTNNYGIRNLIKSKETDINNIINKKDQSNNIIQKTISSKCKKENKKKHYFCECGKEIKKLSKRCPTCDKINKRKVKNRPEKDELIKMIKETSLEAVGRKFGVTGKAIKKWII